MRKLLAVVSILAVFALAACGGIKNYTVTMNDGTTYTTASEPEFNAKSKTYTFQNLDGNPVTVQQVDVKEIMGHKK